MTIFSLTSCLGEELGGDDNSKDKGNLVLDIDLLKPVSRTVSEVKDYPVAIFNSEGKQVASYDQVSLIPEKITLNVGNYSVTSHTPGAIAKKMYFPYYAGSVETEILKGIDSKVDVVCKMKNSKISVNYDDDFKNVFDTWEITITDGSETVLSFTNLDPISTVYWYFGENGVPELVVNFRGVTKEGSTIAARNVLTKDQAEESYDDDNDYFSGGEALTLNFTPSESTDGKIVGVTINADLTFEESDEDVTVNVVDKPGFEEGDPVTPPTPGPGTDDNTSITLTLPAPITLSADDAATADPSTGDVKIEAVDGIKSVKVRVDSKSDEMMEQLAAVAGEYPGVDLVNGCEVVGNQNLVAFLASLGKDITVPAAGDKNYTFPVGQFYLFLGILSGEHNFIMTVTDINGVTKSGTIKVTITE